MANIGNKDIASVADNAPGFFRIPLELDDAVAKRLTEPAKSGNKENVSNNAPTFCNSSPAFAAVMKNGGTVTNSSTIFAFSKEPDQIGALAACGITWYAKANIRMSGTQPSMTRSDIHTI